MGISTAFRGQNTNVDISGNTFGFNQRGGGLNTNTDFVNHPDICSFLGITTIVDQTGDIDVITGNANIGPIVMNLNLDFEKIKLKKIYLN